jgi:MoaA/NifB/PqqE/SkfB family radical SAM enzyme
MPEFLIVTVTHRCDYGCAHCFQPRDTSASELTTDEWTRVARTVATPAVIVLTGGEPTLRPDLPEIARAFGQAAGSPVFGFVTNGSDPDRVERAAVEILEQLPGIVLTVSVSLDGPPAVHDSLRRHPGAHAAASRTLDRLAARASGNGRLKVGLSATFGASTCATLPGFLVSARKEWPLDHVAMTLVRGDPRDPAEARVDLDRYREAMELVHDRALATGLARRTPLARLGAVLSRAKAGAIAATAQDGAWHVPCTAGSLVGVIEPDGTVRPCELKPDTFGNLRECGLDFAALWTGARADGFRRALAASRCRCTHECYLSTSLAVHPGRMAKVCWRTR